PRRWRGRPSWRHRSLRARQSGVPSVCPHLLEDGVEVGFPPRRDPDPEGDESCAEDLALEEPEAIRELVGLRSTWLDERHRIDLDHCDVEATGTEVLQRRDESLVDERRQSEDERRRGEDAGRNEV